MKKTVVKSSDPKPEADKAKRVYRAAVDIIRKLDDILKQKRAFRDVFLPDAIHLRNSLQDYCERLMFYDPIEFGRKVEELMWRKVFYDVITLMKHNRKQMRPNSSLESAFRTHLLAAAGFYHHLLFKLQCEFSLKLEGVIDFYHQGEPKAYQKPHQQRGKSDVDPAVKEWAVRACHRCLVYLGDIARYQQDYDGMPSRVLAQRHYHQAIVLCPDLGMPHNQLGTLAGGRYYHIDSAYCYLRCMVSTHSFEGASDNLTRLLDKNLRRYTELCIQPTSPRELPPEQQRWRDIKKFAVKFLHLLYHFFKKNKNNSGSIQELCQSTLQDFQGVMFIQPPVVRDSYLLSRQHYASDDRPLFMDDELVFKILVICMSTVHELQKAGQKQVAAAIALTLALFSHVLNHTVIRLQSALCDAENANHKLSTSDSLDELTTTDVDQDIHDDRRSSTLTPHNSDTSQSTATERTNKKQSKTSARRVRRKRKRYRSGKNSSSESETHDLSGLDSDLSEGEDGEAHLTDSGDEIIKEYLQGSDSTDTDSDDNLMISQELRPGFASSSLLTVSTNSLAGVAEEVEPDLPEPNSQNMVEEKKENNFTSLNTEENFDGVSSETSYMNTAQQQQSGLYLGDFPHDWLSDATSFFSQSRRFGGSLEREANSESEEHIKAVVQAKKDVPVPPGFEQSSESHHVMEITQKLANFVIETDTEASNFPTDTEPSVIATESELETETDTENDGGQDKEGQELERWRRVMEVIQHEGLLTSVKVFTDWMRCHPHVIATCAKSCSSLWTRLAVLLNFLPSESVLASMDFCHSDDILEHVTSLSSSSDLSHAVPLSEDLHLRGFPPLTDAHKSISMATHDRLDLSLQQEAVLRVSYLRQFGYFVARLKSIRFTYEEEKGEFCGPAHLNQQEQHNVQHKDESNRARREQLMRDMAQLRLQAEVSQLEGSLAPSSSSSAAAAEADLPPYLLPDALCLCQHLSQLKQLAASSRFIIIIPLSVIDHLDLLKKEKIGARDGIRWLESEFHRGSRFVRAQKPHEKTMNLPQKQLKKRDRDAWRFLQVVDCGQYFTQQCSDGEGRGMVCILTSDDAMHSQNTESSRLKQAIVAAQQEGIMVQSVNDFHTKWKEASKSNKG